MKYIASSKEMFISENGLTFIKEEAKQFPTWGDCAKACVEIMNKSNSVFKVFIVE